MKPIRTYVHAVDASQIAAGHSRHGRVVLAGNLWACRALGELAGGPALVLPHPERTADESPAGRLWRATELALRFELEVLCLTPGTSGLPSLMLSSDSFGRFAVGRACELLEIEGAVVVSTETGGVVVEGYFSGAAADEWRARLASAPLALLTLDDA